MLLAVLSCCWVVYCIRGTAYCRDGHGVYVLYTVDVVVDVLDSGRLRLRSKLEAAVSSVAKGTEQKGKSDAAERQPLS